MKVTPRPQPLVLFLMFTSVSTSVPSIGNQLHHPGELMMLPPVASVQSALQPEILSPKRPKQTFDAVSTAGDCLTSSDIETFLLPPPHKWRPRTAYREMGIGDLAPGPGYVTIMGRIVNFYEASYTSKSPIAAKGSYKVVVKDDTGTLTVKLWYAKVDYHLRLGLLVSIWTPHVSSAESGTLNLQQNPLITSVFPERDSSCYFLVHESGDEGRLCKTPLGRKEGNQLAGLLTLRAFVEGGYDVSKAKLLVCVKSIGGRKSFSTKKGNRAEKVEIRVFDDTAESMLTLWGCICSSAAAWEPSHTVLLISYPEFKVDRRPTILMKNGTYIEVDPLVTDACWLRAYAQRLTKREHVNQPFPENLFDIEAAASSEVRVLYTLADIDEFARAAPAEQYIGYLSLTIVELNLFSLYQKNMMLCEECCGVPIFANAMRTKCKQCEKEVPLRINPRLVGLLIDETGAVTSGKLIWSDDSWSQLLGRTAEELASSDATLLRYLENRLLFLKLAVMFGWSSSVGKLAVLRVTTV
ncbi:MAG: hypothetical protein Q9217_002121 [Psora testacea]